MQDQYVGQLRIHAAHYAEEALSGDAADRQSHEIIKRYLLVASDASLDELEKLFNIWNSMESRSDVDNLAVSEVCEIIEGILIENDGLTK